MNGLKKSEAKTLKYLTAMFPGYAWGKTAGGGQLDFMGAPPPDADLPMLFVESKCDADRTRESQNEWAKSEIGLRCRKFVCYTPDDDNAPCFLYTWDDWLLFVEQEDVIARIERHNKERAASVGLTPGEYTLSDARARVAVDGTFTVLAGSLFRADEPAQSIPANVKEIRDVMILEGKLVPSGDRLRLVEDTVFSSSSAAATCINGYNCSGPRSFAKVDTVQD
jgi:hypothetical protein